MGRAKKTREYIIAKAAPVFNRQGFSGTSITDILEGSGLTKGSVYGNFSSKEELAAAAFEYNFKRISTLIFSSVERDGNACDRLVALAGSYGVNFDQVSELGGCPILNAATDSDDMNSLIREKVNRSIELWKKTIVSIIRKGQELGEIKADISAEDFALLFILNIEGALMLAKTMDEKRHLELAISHITSLVDGIRK
jgi:AcrR family transcriptional regulator